jgi:ABC-type nitrate/sulfonate/bicarbonate transport system substrate-binding protein
VVSGSLDVGAGNNLSPVIGSSAGLPLRVAASGVDSTGDPDAVRGILPTYLDLPRHSPGS